MSDSLEFLSNISFLVEFSYCLFNVVTFIVIFFLDNSNIRIVLNDFAVVVVKILKDELFDVQVKRFHDLISLDIVIILQLLVLVAEL